jgi:hypothetical protein
VGAELAHAAASGKLSERLIALISPIYENRQPSDIDQYRKDIGLAALAWNLALSAESDGIDSLSKALDDVTDELTAESPGATPQQWRALRNFLGHLVVRKLEMFPDDPRVIFNVRVDDRGDEFYVEVVSQRNVAPAPAWDSDADPPESPGDAGE